MFYHCSYSLSFIGVLRISLIFASIFLKVALKVSKSIVRTTHLTGLFTDLGIELSQLFFYKKPEETKQLKTNIYLKIAIITFFFLGCFIGGYIYLQLELKTLFVAVFFLLIALFYDAIRLQFHRIKRKTLSDL